MRGAALYAPTFDWVNGLDGKMLEEGDGTGDGTAYHMDVPTQPLGGQLLTSYAYANWYYAFNDWLGTKRATALQDGTPQLTFPSLPFGDGDTDVGGVSEIHFTGQPLEFYTTNDYFSARFYRHSLGRFVTPDWSGLYYANPANPQSLNLYSYVLNNPLNNIDPSGQECVWDDGSYDAADDPQTGNAAGCSSQGGTYIDPSMFENATLTNGQQSNTNYGDWSSNPNSTIAQSWTDPSSITNGGSNADIPLSGTFNFNNLTQDEFIQQMTVAGVPISQWDTANNKLHNGTQLRSAKRYCGLHVTIDPGSGQNGKPVTGNFHLDLYDPVSLSNTNQLNYGFTALHAAFDVVPDKLQENGLPWFPTGNQQCPYQ